MKFLVDKCIKKGIFKEDSVYPTPTTYIETYTID